MVEFGNGTEFPQAEGYMTTPSSDELTRLLARSEDAWGAPGRLMPPVYDNPQCLGPHYRRGERAGLMCTIPADCGGLSVE